MNFEQFLQQKGIVPKTIERHEREILKYKKWLNARGGSPQMPDNATKKDLLDYLGHIKEKRSLSNASQNQILQKLKNYYSYLAQEKDVYNISTFIKIRGVNKRHLRPILTTEELDLLCDAFYYHTQNYKASAKEIYFYPDQTTLLQGYYITLTLMAYQALQLQEIESLTTDNFDLRKATITVHQSRTGAGRILALEASQMGVLMQYFTNTENTVVMPNRNHFEKLSKMLKPIFPKYQDFTQIRASRITHWIKTEGLRKAQYKAGHKNIQSTEKYLAGDFETLQNDFDNFHPLR